MPQTVTFVDSRNVEQTSKTLDALDRNLVLPSKSSFQRPNDTTPYGVGDLVADNTTPGSVTRLSWTGATKTGSGGSGRIVGLTMEKSGTAACTLRVHFLKTSHAVTNGDNGALVLTSLDLDNYLGSMDVTFSGSTGAYEGIGSGGAQVSKSFDAPVPYVLASGDTIYGLVETLSVYTPAAQETYRVRPCFEVNS